MACVWLTIHLGRQRKEKISCDEEGPHSSIMVMATILHSWLLLLYLRASSANAARLRTALHLPFTFGGTTTTDIHFMCCIYRHLFAAHDAETRCLTPHTSCCLAPKCWRCIGGIITDWVVKPLPAIFRLTILLSAVIIHLLFLVVGGMGYYELWREGIGQANSNDIWGRLFSIGPLTQTLDVGMGRGCPIPHITPS